MTINLPLHLLNTAVKVCLNLSGEGELNVDDFSIKDLERLNSFKSAQRRKEFIQSRVALLEALGEGNLKSVSYLGKKPVHPRGSISISHCSGGAAAIFGVGVEVGIDMETERPQLSKIAHKFTTEEEKDLFPTAEKNTLQFIWGVKESLFKLYGYGGVDFKEHLKITDVSWNHEQGQGWGIAWIHKVCEQRPKPIQCLFQIFKVEGFYLAVATHRAEMPPFESERLKLREWTLDDSSWLYELNSNPNVIKFTGDAGFSDEQKAHQLIATYPNYQRDGYGRWMVCLKESGVPIGWCGLKNNPWGIDLGFRFFEKYWGQGFGYEAAKATVDWARDKGLERLIGRTLSENKGSIRILEKVGMKHLKDDAIEDFAKVHPISDSYVQQWTGQTLKNYLLEL